MGRLRYSRSPHHFLRTHMKKVVIFGGSFNPPGIHHIDCAKELAKRFDEVIVVPCGPRPDKEATNDIEPVHRAAMADLAFRGIPDVRVDLFDLECGTFTCTEELDRRYAGPGREVWHFVGTDLVQDGGQACSVIHRAWKNGHELWNRLNFVVGEREGYPIVREDIPKKAEVIRIPRSGSSTDIRRRAFERQSLIGHVHDDVRAYIKRHGLYTGRPPLMTADFDVEEHRARFVYDDWNPKAVALAGSLRDIVDADDPNCIVVIGGDGTMLHAIREHWQSRLPFIGINTGGRGFLLNEPAVARHGNGLRGSWKAERHPLLFVEVQRADGVMETVLGFNEVWLERASGQTAWTQVRVNGEIRLPKLVSDGVLIGTPAGSTAYARAMGAPALPLSASVLTLIGSNVLEPSRWKWAHLPLESRIDVTSLGGDKRPVRAFVDGFDKGVVDGIRVRVSRVASVELAFAHAHDMASKLSRVQFPVKI